MSTSTFRSDTGLTVKAAIYPTPGTMYDHASDTVVSIPSGLEVWRLALVPVSERQVGGQGSGIYELTIPTPLNPPGWRVDWFAVSNPTPADAVASDAGDVRLAGDGIDAIQVDGISFVSLLEIALSVLAGKTSVSASTGETPDTITYHRRDGTTAKLTVRCDLLQPGLRQSSTINS